MCNRVTCSPHRRARRRRVIGARAALLLAFAIAALGLAGRADYEDARLQAEEYCDNVRSGVWPDYEGTYEEHCPHP